jgi:D-tyrosyl-tRNA(Tyr) deacylase
MRTIIQRVTSASVSVDGIIIASIDAGLMILLGVGPEDSGDNALQLARKVAALRIFSDEQGKMNLSVKDIRGSAIVVSQFTLFADTRKGNRPSFIGAAQPEHARPLCDRFSEFLQQEGVPTQTGEFGAHMVLSIINDGPVTITLEM